MSAGIDTIRVILPIPQVVRIENVTITGSGGGGNISVIDLGVINATEVYQAGVVELIPYTPGRFVRKVFFTFGGYVPDTENTAQGYMYFLTPNQCVVSGSYISKFGGTNDFLDTDGCRAGNFLVDPDGYTSGKAPILDSTPLYAANDISGWFRRVETWAPSKSFSDTGWVILVGESSRMITANGITGSEEPDWSDPGTIIDGTITWSEPLPFPPNEIRAFAEVVDVPGLSLPIPTSIEWLVQPSNAVAGESISPAMQLRVLDQNGDPYLFASPSASLNLWLMGDPAITSAQVNFSSMDPVTGIMTFDTLSIPQAGTGYILNAEVSSVAVPTVDSDPFDVTAP